MWFWFHILDNTAKTRKLFILLSLGYVYSLDWNWQECDPNWNVYVCVVSLDCRGKRPKLSVLISHSVCYIQSLFCAHIASTHTITTEWDCFPSQKNLFTNGEVCVIELGTERFWYLWRHMNKWRPINIRQQLNCYFALMLRLADSAWWNNGDYPTVNKLNCHSKTEVLMKVHKERTVTPTQW